MTKRRRIRVKEAAQYLGMSPQYLSRCRIELETKYNFPKQIPVVGGYDRVAIDNWLDKTGGLISDDFSVLENELIERAQSGQF